MPTFIYIETQIEYTQFICNLGRCGQKNVCINSNIRKGMQSVKGYYQGSYKCATKVKSSMKKFWEMM